MIPFRVQDYLHRTTALWLFGVLASSAVAAPPELNYLYPAGGQRGMTFVTACDGDFEWPVGVWSPGVSIKPLDEKGKLEVTVPADLPADRVWLRLFNAEGVSDAVPLLIGSLPETTEVEPNNTTKEAQETVSTQGPIAITVNGKLNKNGDVDCFATVLKKGETLVAALAANSQFGSPMDAILQLVTPTGTVLADSHDAVGLDPRMAFTAPADGTYIVRLFAFASNPNTRIEFHGGDNYIYRLTLTNGPFITHAMPFCASDFGVRVEPIGWNIPPDTRLPIVEFGEGQLAERPEVEDADFRLTVGSRLGFVFDNRFAGSARLRIVPHDVTEGWSTNATPAPLSSARNSIRQATVPFSTAGWIARPNQDDQYLFPIEKDDQVIIAVESLAIDLPLVPLARLTDPMDGVAAENLDANDVVFQHVAQQSGEYKLLIMDRYRKGGERYRYRLTVRKLETDFQLVADADSILIHAGKPAELGVAVNRVVGRQGSIGPITIEAVDLPAGITCKPVVSSPEGDTSKKVSLSFDSDGTAYSGPIRIKGTADHPRSIERISLTPAKYKARTNVIWTTATASNEEPAPAE